MGNNSYLPVLGGGIAIIFLNGQCILVHHTPHVPGLAIPLFILRAYLKQHGSGFLGDLRIRDAGIFPLVCSLGGYVVGLPPFLQASW